MNVIPEMVGTALALWDYISRAWDQWLVLFLVGIVLVTLSTTGVALAPLVRDRNVGHRSVNKASRRR